MSSSVRSSLYVGRTRCAPSSSAISASFGSIFSSSQATLKRFDEQSAGHNDHERDGESVVKRVACEFALGRVDYASQGACQVSCSECTEAARRTHDTKRAGDGITRPR